LVQNSVTYFMDGPLVGLPEVRCFGSLSGMKMIEIPDNAYVSSIFCATDTDTASVLYFGESHMATLTLSPVFYIN